PEGYQNKTNQINTHILPKSVQQNLGVEDKAQIDLLVVYTPAAKEWADTYEGGIDNTIGLAIAKCNLVSKNSELGITFNLVHSTEVDYEESGDSYVDINNLIDGSIPNVCNIRDMTAADLVVLFTTNNDFGGMSWLLQDKNGEKDYGFNLCRVQQVSGLTAIHEIGHNMGAHHTKEQLSYPGPTVWSNWPENTWSAGWRWKGLDDKYYCTVMGYNSGCYYSDENLTMQVPYFSDPNISFLGNATGDATNGDNARTIRETKLTVAAYREEQHPNKPTIYTLNVHDITTESAVSGGCVVKEGNSSVTSRGVVYSTSRMPTLNDSFTVDSSGIGSFNSELTGLEITKVYYIRAYATNEEGTKYGNQVVYIHNGGVERDFITRWELPEGQDKLEIILDRSGVVDYTWETLPEVQTGSGIFPKGQGIVEIPNLPAGQTIRVSIAPSNLNRFYNFYFVCHSPVVYGPDRENLVDVEQWGTVHWSNMEFAFKGCKNLNISATDLPDLNNVNTMSWMFEECSILNGPTNINDWDVSKVTDMNEMFSNAYKFNQNIGDWDVSKVTDMSCMFSEASTFNQNIGNWNLINATNLDMMLDYCGMDNHNYSTTLISWSENSGISDSITLGAEGLKYGSNACEARDYLIREKGWTINGDKQSTTGVEKSLNGIKISVYPNPVLNDLVITAENNTSKINFQIINAIGQTVLTGSFVHEKAMPTNNLKPGVYFVRLENKKLFEFKKVVKN
ncbi:MAG: BspA family leucine-rich repeat surface protein, partial [Bacteroidales bacterium]|nr:BspA family leucine-rich repeat surface protein [Bacteroidales bacterium]